MQNELQNVMTNNNFLNKNKKTKTGEKSMPEPGIEPGISRSTV